MTPTTTFSLTAIGNGKVTFKAPSPAPNVYVIETRPEGSGGAWTEQVWYPPLFAAPGETLTALVSGSGNIDIRVKARSRAGDSDPSGIVTQAAAWWHRDAVWDLDDENSRWMFNGVIYGSKADMIAAGFLSQTGGIDRYNTTGLIPAWYMLAAKGTTASTTVGATARYLIALDDGGDGNIANELVSFYQSLVSSNQYFGCRGFRASKSILSSQQGTAASIGNSADVRAAIRIRSSSQALSVNGGTILLNGAVTSAPVTTQLVIGNVDNGSRPWAGVFKRCALLASQGTVADIQGLLA